MVVKYCTYLTFLFIRNVGTFTEMKDGALSQVAPNEQFVLCTNWHIFFNCLREASTSPEPQWIEIAIIVPLAALERCVRAKCNPGPMVKNSLWPGAIPFRKSQTFSFPPNLPKSFHFSMNSWNILTKLLGPLKFL